MSKLLSLFFAVLISCNSPSQEKNTANKETVIQNSFSEKNEKEFLENFPKDFVSFKGTFGWNDTRQTPEKLYKNSEQYIKYWFSLLEKPQYRKYEKGIISIAENGKWEADAVNYFQNQTVDYIKKNDRYQIINDLDRQKAKHVLSFLTSGPAFKYDEVFVRHLNEEKQTIIAEISGENFSPEKKRSTFSTYENNDDFFIKSFDVNNDGVSDRMVSSKPYRGNDFFVFLGDKKGNYQLVLETTNFSEDGGHVISDISKLSHGKGLSIKTSFPDRGYDEKEMILVPENNSWFLKKIVYKTMSDLSAKAVKYICDVSQNIDITRSGWSGKINQIPAENERNKKCMIENVNADTAGYFVQDPDGYTNLRKEKNTSSQILQKINSGERVHVINTSGDWFYIKTDKGNKGFVHKTRIKNSAS